MYIGNFTSFTIQFKFAIIISGDILKDNKVISPIEPIWNENSKILILGSFPSVKSREMNFYYGHPQNRFWRVLAGVFDSEIPYTIEEKRLFLIKNNIALWDVVHSCEIEGSSDSSIKNVVANDISGIINFANINAVFTNGKTADKLYIKYIEPKVKMKAICLPSTSPANAAWKLEKLTEYWKNEIIKYI